MSADLTLQSRLLSLAAAPQDETHAAPFVVVPLDDLAHTEPAPPAYWWDGYLPAGVVTLLGAHGGTGKSTLALMLAACVALGLPLFGITTRRGRVAFFSGEDPAELVRYRLHLICGALDVSVASLDGWLFILDATAGDPALFHELSVGGKRHGATTPTYDALAAFAEQSRIDVLIVDNASDAFDASEIDRARVRGFMRALARIAQAHAGAVLLLVHVDKTTARGLAAGSDSYSGSTAWHNSARSRLFLSRDKDGAGLTLEHQKHNLGRLRESLHLVWPEGGMLQVDAPSSGIVRHIEERGRVRAILRLVHEFTQRGEFVSTATTSRTHAGKLLRGQPGFPQRLQDADLFDLLRDGERRGLLVRELVRSSGRGHEKEVWRVTTKGAEWAEIADFAPTAPTAPTSVVEALGASGAEARADCADFGVGGCGGNGGAHEVDEEADA